MPATSTHDPHVSEASADTTKPAISAYPTTPGKPNSKARLDEVTASFGIAGWNSDMKSPGDLIRAADEALYEAKHQGRNRVCSARR